MTAMGSHLRLLQATEDAPGRGTWVEVRAPASRRAAMVLSLASALLLAAALLVTVARQRSRTEVGLLPVTVAPGDTLWGLASRHSGAGEYLPKAVYEIRQANGLRTSRLMPGQRLVIPVKVKAPLGLPVCMSLARTGTP